MTSCIHCGTKFAGECLCLLCAGRALSGTLGAISGNICTLLGPTAHHEAFDAASIRLGKLGWLVFTVGSHILSDVGLGTTDEERRVYWKTHREKMDLSSMAFVVDLPHPDASPSMRRVGTDTQAEIDYAEKIGIKVVRMADVWPSRLPVPERTEGAGDGKDDGGKDKGDDEGARAPEAVPTQDDDADVELARVRDKIDRCRGSIRELVGRRGSGEDGAKQAEALCRELDALFTRRGALMRKRAMQPGGAGGNGAGA